MKKLLMLVLLVYSVTGYGQVFKCVENGKTVFSDRPCPSGEVKSLDVNGVKHFSLSQVTVAGVRLGMRKDEALWGLSGALGIPQRRIQEVSRSHYALQITDLSVKHNNVSYTVTLMQKEGIQAIVVAVQENYQSSADLQKKRGEILKEYGKPTRSSDAGNGEVLTWCPGYTQEKGLSPCQIDGKYLAFHHNGSGGVFKLGDNQFLGDMLR